MGVWLDADEGVRAGESKTGRPQVKAKYNLIWKKVEPVGAELHDKGPTQNESPSARLSDLGSKSNIKEVVRYVKAENVSKIMDSNGEPMVWRLCSV